MGPLQLAYRTCARVHPWTHFPGISARSESGTDISRADPLAPERIVTAVRDGSPERVERAVGRLTATPVVPRPTAMEVCQPLVDRCTDPSPIVQRAAYRGLHPIHVQHPDLVEPHVRSLTTGLTAFQIRTREQCGALFASICSRSPRFAPLLYPLLQSTDRHVRDTTLSALVTAAGMHPVVLAPVWPLLHRELRSPTVDRLQLIRAVDRVATSERTTIDVPVDTVLEWFGSVEMGTELALIDLLQPRSLDADQRATVVTHLLSLLPSADRRRSDEFVSLLAILVRRDPAVVSAIHAWSGTASSVDRRRVQARFDAHTDGTSLPRVKSRDHSVATARSSVPGSP